VIRLCPGGRRKKRKSAKLLKRTSASGITGTLICLLHDPSQQFKGRGAGTSSQSELLEKGWWRWLQTFVRYDGGLQINGPLLTAFLQSRPRSVSAKE